MTVTASDPITVISSIGDPRKSRTWSGTPYGIITAFERAGHTVRTHTLDINRPLKYLYTGSNMLRAYGTLQPNRVGMWNAHQRRAADTIAEASGAGNFLHFGSDHLPLLRMRPGQKHFLLTDYSINLLLTDGVLGERAPKRYRDAVRGNEEQIAKRMDGVFTVSRYVLEDWLNAYHLRPDQVVAIGTGLGNPLTLDGFVKDYRTGHLLFVARHGFDIKGGPLLLEGFVEALKTRPDLRLVVIASTADPTCAPHVAMMQDHPSIDFHRSGTPDFVDLVRGAALYAGPAQREPWGLIYLESLMCETPVLGLDRGAFRELTDDGRVGFIVEEETAAAVGQAIVQAMSNPERLAQMGRDGRAFVESRFTWDHVAQTILKTWQVSAAEPA